VYVRVPLKGLQISQKYVTSPESSEMRGGVSVTFQTTLDPCKISYQVSIDRLLRAVVVVVVVFVFLLFIYYLEYIYLCGIIKLNTCCFPNIS